MVSKYAKNKYTRPGERNHGQAMAAAQDLKIHEKKAEAYRNLIKTWRYMSGGPPAFGVYRNLRGDFVKIVKAGDAFTREDVPASQQDLATGCLWLPAFPLGIPGTQLNEWSEFDSDMFQYVLVKPVYIGFNEWAAEGQIKVYQPKRITISVNDMGESFWEGVSTTQLDPSLGYVVVSSNGHMQTYPAGSYLPTPNLTPVVASALAPTPQEELDTAGEIPMGSTEEQVGGQKTPDSDMNLFPETLLSFRPDCDGVDPSFGCDNSVNISGQTDDNPYAGYAPAQDFPPN